MAEQDHTAENDAPCKIQRGEWGDRYCTVHRRKWTRYGNEEICPDAALAVLEAHIFDKAMAKCGCGLELGGRGHRTRAWREHVAEVLTCVTSPVTSVEPGCTCGGMAACPQCQERDAQTCPIPPEVTPPTTPHADDRGALTSLQKVADLHRDLYLEACAALDRVSAWCDEQDVLSKGESMTTASVRRAIRGVEE